MISPSYNFLSSRTNEYRGSFPSGLHRRPMAAIAAKAVAKKRANGNKAVPFIVPELPWKKEVAGS